MLLDPHYRTREGFRALVELHWAAFGHQFAERMGSTAPEGSAAPSASYPGTNNHSPIFLQWIDCIAQLLRLYPTAFHYSTVRHPSSLILHPSCSPLTRRPAPPPVLSQAFLVTFLDLVLSGRFHNFLCNRCVALCWCPLRLRG